MLDRTIRRLRRSLKRMRAVIAAARLRRLRNELVCHGGFVGAPDVGRRPQLPMILGDKWDF